MKAKKPEQLSVLLEHETGVMEVFFTLLRGENRVIAYPVSSVPRAGTIRPTDRAQLQEALELLEWSHDHMNVFEGVVTAD